MSVKKPRFKRILLKLSGEALMGNKPYGVDPSVLKTVAAEIQLVHELGVEIGIVIGGGNIFRGLHASEYGMGRVAADYMGMLGTVMNAIALGEALSQRGSEARIMSAIGCARSPAHPPKAVTHLRRGESSFRGGHGIPISARCGGSQSRESRRDRPEGHEGGSVYSADLKKSPLLNSFPGFFRSFEEESSKC
jgi:uridylate kinase